MRIEEIDRDIDSSENLAIYLKILLGVWLVILAIYIGWVIAFYFL